MQETEGNTIISWYLLLIFLIVQTNKPYLQLLFFLVKTFG